MACKLLISDLAPAGQIDSRRILQEQGCLDKKAKYTAVHPNEIAGLEPGVEGGGGVRERKMSMIGEWGWE